MNQEKGDEKETEKLFLKVKWFFEKGLMVHILTKNERFYNGFISEVRADFFVINDRFVGNIPVFYSELLKIEEFLDENKKSEVDNGEKRE